MTAPLASPPGHRPRPARRAHALRVVAAGLTVLVVLSLAACGGAAQDGGVVSLKDPSASPDPSSSPSASLDPEEAMLAFTKCMKEHGVDIQVAMVTGEAGGSTGSVQVGGPDEGSGAQPAQPVTGEFDPKALEEADKACRHLLPASGMGDPGATIDPAFADQLLKFAQCMRDHGVDFPDPEISVSGGAVQAIGGGTSLDPNSKAFQDAQAACGSELPGGAPFVVGGTSSGTGPAIQVNP